MPKSALDIKAALDVLLESSGLDEGCVSELLCLAGIDPTDEQAAGFLRLSYQAACAGAHPKARFRPSQNDHNAPLNRVQEAAQELLTALKSLADAHPHANAAFWLNEAWELPLFQPWPDPSDKTEPRDDARYGSKVLLDRLMTTAENAKIHGKGGRPKGRTKRIIRDAFDFYVRNASEKPSSTATGNFANFARAFFKHVTGDVEKSEKLNRAIRDVVVENSKKMEGRST